MEGRFLASLCRREVPDLDLPVCAPADDVLAVGVPIDGETRAIMSRDPHEGSVGLARIPHLNGAAVRGRRKHDAVAGGPPDVPDGIAVALVDLLAAARGKAPIRGGSSQIPHSNGAILAAGQQPSGTMGIEGESVNLAVMTLEAT